MRLCAKNAFMIFAAYGEEETEQFIAAFEDYTRIQKDVFSVLEFFIS